MKPIKLVSAFTDIREKVSALPTISNQFRLPFPFLFSRSGLMKLENSIKIFGVCGATDLRFTLGFTVHTKGLNKTFSVVKRKVFPLFKQNYEIDSKPQPVSFLIERLLSSFFKFINTTVICC